MDPRIRYAEQRPGGEPAPQDPRATGQEPAQDTAPPHEQRPPATREDIPRQHEPVSTHDQPQPEQHEPAARHEPGAPQRIHPDETYLHDPDFHTDRRADFDALGETQLDTGIVDPHTGELRHEQVRREALALRDAHESLRHMSDNGAYAVHSYTRHEVFHQLNEALRNGSDRLPELVGQARAIISGLNELPPFEGETARTINHHGDMARAALTAAHYEPGRIVVETQFNSSSRVTPEHPNSAFPGEVELRVHSRTGREISDLASVQREREVLFKPGTQLLVHSRELITTPDGKQKWVIHAEEIAPGDPRHLDAGTARDRMAERRERAASEVVPREARPSIAELLNPGSADTPSHHDPAPEPTPEPARPGLGEPQGGWSALNRITDPPGVAAIHAGTAETPQQQVRFLRAHFPAIADVNARNFYAPGAMEHGYRTNCTRSVVAFEERMRGGDAHAEPLLPGDMPAKGTLESIQRQLGGQWSRQSDFAHAINEVANQPVGSRAVLAYQYQVPADPHAPPGSPESVPRIFGHVVTAVHTEHGVAIIDPQRNRLANLPANPVSVDLLPYHRAEAPSATPEHGTEPHTAEHPAPERPTPEHEPPAETEPPKQEHPDPKPPEQVDNGHGTNQGTPPETPPEVLPSRIGPDGRPVPVLSHALDTETPVREHQHAETAPHHEKIAESYGTEHEDHHEREQPEQRPWPADPETGRPLTARDLDFLGLNEERVRWWQEGLAPLGMTPDQFREFRSSLAEALAPHGIRPEDVQVKLVGSAVRGWSGWTKTMENIEHTEESRARMAEWLGDDPGPVRRPFDVMHRLGLGDPSDYDVSFHSDKMVQLVRERWQAAGGPGEFSHKHGFVDKNFFAESFPELQEWRERWRNELGRKVGERLFGLEEEPLQRRSSRSSASDDAWPLDLGEHHAPEAPEVRPHPADPVNGYQIQRRDQEFLGYTDEQIHWWRTGEAPMGMTPRQFHDFRSSLLDALRREGIDAENIDVRLKGSGVNFFSNKRKLLPTLEDLADNPEAAAKLREWLGDDPDRPISRPFDSMHKLGLDPEPSDFDIQIRSDQMAQLTRRLLESDPSVADFYAHEKYRFVNKDLMFERFPALAAWVERWEGELGREVAPALFGLEGEPRQESHADPEKAKRGWPIAGPEAPPLGPRPPAHPGGYGMAEPAEPAESAEPPETPEHPPGKETVARLSPDSPVVTDAPESPPKPPAEAVADPVVDETGWHWKGLHLTPEQNAVADAFIPRFAEVGRGADGHGGVRARLLEIQDRVPGTRLEGLEHDLKGADRLKQKVAEALREEPDADPEQILRSVPDGMRYTFSFDTENYAAGVAEVRAELHARGYEQVLSKNAWADDRKPYQGINTRWRDPVSGLTFEVQFHTPESWHVKSETHDAYEHENNMTISQEQREAWSEYQRRYFALIPVPEGARDIGAED